VQGDEDDDEHVREDLFLFDRCVFINKCVIDYLNILIPPIFFLFDRCVFINKCVIDYLNILIPPIYLFILGAIKHKTLHTPATLFIAVKRCQH